MASGHFSILCILVFVPLAASQGLKYVVIGDWGDDNQDQYNVADAMSNWCSSGVKGPCEFIVGTGDNFYPDGVLSNDSTRFNTTWKWIYDLPNIRDLVWYQVLGNHDYWVDDRELYQVEYAQTDPLWNMPWIYYDFTAVGADGVTVHFIGIDSDALMLRKHDSEAQLAWFEATLAASTADWKVVWVHHPPYSSGDYTGNPTMREFIVPLLNEYNVELLFGGNDHNLEHISSANVTDYVVSGAGGRGLYEHSPVAEEILNGWGLTLNYFGFHFGFVSMEMTKTGYTAEFVDDTGVVRYSFSRTK